MPEKNVIDAYKAGCECAICARLRWADNQLRDAETVTAVCGGRCTKKGRGARVDSYYGKAFSAKKFARGPICDNCKAPMVEVVRIPVGA